MRLAGLEGGATRGASGRSSVMPHQETDCGVCLLSIAPVHRASEAYMLRLPSLHEPGGAYLSASSALGARIPLLVAKKRKNLVSATRT